MSAMVSEPTASGGQPTFMILAGGLGTRLRHLSDIASKPAIMFGGRFNVLRALADRAASVGSSVIVVTDERNLVPVSSVLDRSMATIVIDRGGGTGAAILEGLVQVDGSRVVLCNSDTLVPIDVVASAGRVAAHLPVVSVLAPRSVQNEGCVGVQFTGRRGVVVRWRETAHEARSRGTAAADAWASSTGCYVADSKFLRGELERWRGSGLSWEHDVIPQLVIAGALGAVVDDVRLPVFDFGERRRLGALQADDQLRHRLISAAGLALPAQQLGAIA